MVTPTIVGNQLRQLHSIVRRVSKHMRMLVDYCLTSVDEVQRDEEITDRLFGVVRCRASVSGYGTLADAREVAVVVAVVVVVVQAVVLTLLEAVLRRTSRQLMAQPQAAVGYRVVDECHLIVYSLTM